MLVVAADLADEGPQSGRRHRAAARSLHRAPGDAPSITLAAVQMSACLSRHALNERDMAHVIVKNCAKGVHNELAPLRRGVMLDEDLVLPSSPGRSRASAARLAPAARRRSWRAMRPGRARPLRDRQQDCGRQGIHPSLDVGAGRRGLSPVRQQSDGNGVFPM